MATIGAATSTAVTDVRVTENAVTAVAMDEETTEAVSEAVNLTAEAVSGAENLAAEAVTGAESPTAEVVFTATAALMVGDIGKVNFAPPNNSNGLRHELQAVCFLEKDLPRRTAH
jgi:hypothetical protein